MRKLRFKRFLPLLFCVCMVTMMVPAAFAADASVSNYGDLVTAIANAKEGDTITLGGNIEGDVTIPSGKNIVLDLGGNTLTNTNAGEATLFVENGAVATVKNGTISGGKSHYNIAVGTEKAPGGKLTLENITATAGNAGSSMIDNWGTLTIESGSYTGGLNVVKSEEDSTLVIRGGKFTLNDSVQGYTGVILNYGTATITGGEFIQNSTDGRWNHPQVVVTGQMEGHTAAITTITSGTFTQNKSSDDIFHGLAAATSNNFEVSGGTFNKLVKSSFLSDGLVCKKDSATNTYTLVTGATGVTLSESEITIKVGESIKLEATLTPEDAELKSVTWKTGSKKIATVTNGVVKGVAIGDVTITATPNAAGATPATCKVTVKEDEVAAVGETTYPTLSAAINAAQAGDTITLLKDVAEDIVISSDKTITLDLNGKKLTNSRDNTITNHGKIEIIDETGNGVVDNITNAKAAIKNDGTVVLRGGTYTRSKEAGKDKDNGGGNSYYTILNDNGGSLTIYDGVTVYNDGHFSSMIRNGGTAGAESKLYIIGGTFSGGINTVKNDESGYLNISGGDFRNTTQYVVMNWHKADISGDATFAVNDTAKAVLFTSSYGGADTVKGELTISGGYFKAATDTQDMICDAYDANNKGTAYVSGGYFNKDVAKFCVTGFASVKNTESNANEYPYKVGEMPVNDENEIKQADAVGATTTNVSAIPADKQNEAADVAKTVTPTEISTDNAEVSTGDEQAALTELAKQKKISLDETGKVTDENVTVNIIKQAYLDVTMTAYDVTDTYTVGMDITPRYNLVAVATTGNEKPEVENGYTIASKREMTVTEPTEITVQLPAAFVNKKVYITHEYETGKFKYYTATADEKGQITFVTDGFSPFTFTLTAPDNIVAEVGGDGYTSFADAVAAANDGDTITLIDENATYIGTMTGDARSVKLTNNTAKDITVKINGDNIVVPADGQVTYTYEKEDVSVKTYDIDIEAVNGSVTASHKFAAKGATVTLTPVAKDGYKLDSIKVCPNADGGDALELKALANGTFSFKMPACDVTVHASFVPEKEDVTLPFKDVDTNDWFYGDVAFVYENGIMSGMATDTFAPQTTTTRGMIVCMLHRMEGEVAPSGSNNFTDVTPGAYYENAITWASENGIVNGYSDTAFGPNDAITREQMAAILYRYAQYKDMDVSIGESTNILSYTDAQDVSSYAMKPMQWAVGSGLIGGMTQATLVPQGQATRAQVAAIFHRFCTMDAK